jgi:pyruvate dehydrogenase E2 component (dihydrolipoamide acetyltransferase)
VVREATTRRAIAFSPRASRFAAAHNFYPASIAGSGPGGRVLEHDLRRALEAGASPQSQREPVAAPPLPDHGPATRLRATIARRMRESLASTAQYTLNGSADATGLVSLRARVKTRMADGLRDITIGDLVAFCTVKALLDAPDLNAEYIDGRIVQHAHVHLAFAVDTPRGLLAPVVRNAQDLSVVELSAQLKALAESAVTGAIQPDDLSGATFTVSNLGSLGIESFTPLINPPQVAILGVGTIQPRVVRRTGPRDVVRIRETSARRAMALAGSVEFVDSLGLSLTCDHQVVDGVPGARFLQVVRRKIESVESLVEL